MEREAGAPLCSSRSMNSNDGSYSLGNVQNHMCTIHEACARASSTWLVNAVLTGNHIGPDPSQHLVISQTLPCPVLLSPALPNFQVPCSVITRPHVVTCVCVLHDHMAPRGIVLHPCWRAACCAIISVGHVPIMAQVSAL